MKAGINDVRMFPPPLCLSFHIFRMCTFIICVQARCDNGGPAQYTRRNTKVKFHKIKIKGWYIVMLCNEMVKKSLWTQDNGDNGILSKIDAGETRCLWREWSGP